MGGDVSPTDVQGIVEKYGRPVYEAALRQVYVHIAVRAFWIVLLAVLLGVIAFKVVPFLRRGYRQAKDAGGYDADMWWIIGGVVTGIVTLVLVIALPLLLTDEASDILNPTWAAISIIIGAVTPRS